MTGPFSDLPKYPGQPPPDPDTPPPQPEPPESLTDRLRHAFPALVMLTGAALGLCLVGGLAVVLAARVVEGGWVGPVLLAAVFLTLPTVAVGAAVFQRARARRDRG